MGHRRRSTQYKLTFDDTHGEELAGLEILTRGASLEQLFDVASLGGIDIMNLVGTGLDTARRICATFPDRIVSWNHEDEDGRPIPPTAANFADEDYSFTIPIVAAWMNTIRADPKNARVIGVHQEAPSESEIPPVDLSGLPMTIVEPAWQEQ